MQEMLGYPHLSLLLKASWQAAVLILLVLALQWAFGRRLSPGWRYGLWLLVALRLALPWTVPSAVSLFNFTSLISAPISGARATPRPPGSPALSPATVVQEVGSGEGTAVRLPAATSRSGWAISWPVWLWLAGAGSLAVYLAISHCRIAGRIKAQRPLVDARLMNLLEDCKQLMGVRAPVTLIESREVGSPSLFGFMRPRLLLPAGLAGSFSLDELRYVFLHELAHIKRLDILLGWVMTILQILHWFNPLVWLAFHRMRVDRELACDALALSHAKEAENQPYGRTIIKLLESFGCSAWAPSLAGTLENKNQMKERIRMIAKFKKTKRGPVLAASLFAGLGLLTLTDAQPGQGSKGAEQNSSAQSAGDTQEPPRVIATSPAIGATDVDPAIAEITVTFDHDMQAGFSWTGAGPEHPVVPEGAKVHWRDARTCVYPVKLEAGHYYRVGINSKSYKNFRSVQGVPAGDSALYFTTWGASQDLKLKTMVPQIVSMYPSNGAQDVSPALTELRVMFSVPMGGGMSWCGGGDTYPDSPRGKSAYWTDDHLTCVLPVALKAGHTYQLGINSPSHRNFQSAGGIPVGPVAYKFRTME